MMVGNGLQKEQDAGYAQQAEHFHHTRKKRRPEVDCLMTSLHERRERYESNTQFSCLDLGSGSGRLSALLADEFPNISYTGVDSSSGMVETAIQHFPEHNFVHQDMMSYMEQQPQESIDCVIALASFQHIQGHKNHLLALGEIYKSLKRGGHCYLVNRSFSQWFLKKYRRNALKAVGRSMIRRDRARNDLVIPRKDKSYHKNGKKFNRLYHMFTLPELRNACATSGFVIKETIFIGQDGQKTSNRLKARNSFVVLEKAITTTM